MGLELKGFVPAAFATLLEAQIWETGTAADLRGANTLPAISGCGPGSGEHVQSCWAGWGSPSPAGSSPVEGGPDPVGLQLGSAPVVQRQPKWLCLCASEITGGIRGAGFALTWRGKQDHNKGGFNVNT